MSRKNSTTVDTDTAHGFLAFSIHTNGYGNGFPAEWWYAAADGVAEYLVSISPTYGRTESAEYLYDLLASVEAKYGNYQEWASKPDYDLGKLGARSEALIFLIGALHPDLDEDKRTEFVRGCLEGPGYEPPPAGAIRATFSEQQTIIQGAETIAAAASIPDGALLF